MRRTIRGLGVSVASVTVVATVGSAVGLAEAPGPYPRPGKNELVSVASNGAQADAPAVDFGELGFSDLSANGRFVTFSSVATNLVPGDTNLAKDVFWRDRKAGKTKRVSVASNGAQAIVPPAHGSSGYSISADGRFVAFQSDAINLVPGDTNNAADVFVHDTRTGNTVRVSVSSRGTQGRSGSAQAAISANGRYVAFTGWASNLVPGDTNDVADLFVRDLKTGKTVRASRSSKGVQGNGYSGMPSLSANGRYVVFESSASNLVSGDTNGLPDVFWHDLKTGKTVMASVASNGSPPSFSALPTCAIGAPPLITLPPPSPIESVGGFQAHFCGTSVARLAPHSISGDGRFVTFKSNATNLVPNDSNYNAETKGMDTFVRDVRTRRTERTSIDSYGHEQHTMWFDGAGISASGRYVLTLARGGDSCAETGVLPAAEDVLGCALTGLTRAWVTHIYDRLAGVKEPLAVSMTGKRPKPGPCAGTGRATGERASITVGGAITPDGRYVSLQSSGQDLVPGDRNRLCDYFVRDRGPEAAVGGFGGAGQGSSPGAEPVCVYEDVCVPPLDVLSSRDAADVNTPGADIIGASAVFRPGLGDVYMRLDLARMPVVAGAPAGGLLYGLRFSAGGQRYEVRVQRVPGADFDPKGGASFGLFRQDPVTGLFTKVATLKGGYGTTGDSVVFAIPLTELAGGQLADVRAFTGVGSYLTGVTKVLDAVRLAQ